MKILYRFVIPFISVMLIRPVVCFSEETENKITANILEKQKIACLIFNPGSEITQHIKHCQLWLKATADSFQKIEALQQIAILHIKNNELQEAEKNLEEAFSYLKQANELNYLKYWSDLQHLKALIAFEQGDFKISDAVYRTTLIHLQYQLGEKSEIYNYFAENYIQFLIELERYSEAKDWLKTIILKSSKIKSYKARYNLAVLYLNTGQINLAQKSIEELIVFLDKNHEKSEELKGDVYQLAGRLALIENKLLMAQQYFKMALQNREKIYFQRHIKIADSLASLGTTLAKQEKKAEAEKNLAKAYGMLIELKGEEHPETLKVLNIFKSVVNQKND